MWEWKLRDRGNGYLGHKINRSRPLTVVGISKKDESKVTWRMLMSFKNRIPQERNRRLERNIRCVVLDTLKC